MSYKNLSEIADLIKSGVERLENQELNVADLNDLQQLGRDLHERLTILKYQAVEKVVKPVLEPAPEPTEEPTNLEPVDETEAEAPKTSFKFNIKPVAEEVPKNQRNLLDEIQELTEEEIASANDESTQQKASAKDEETDSSKTVADKLAETKEPLSLADRLKRQPISDLSSAIGMNEKFLFMNDLFLGERDAYYEAINTLNSLSNFIEADNYINNELVGKYTWDMENPSAVRFMELVERRYLG